MIPPYVGGVVAAVMLTLFATLFALDERRKARRKNSDGAR
jgi:hypothetical protein